MKLGHNFINGLKIKSVELNEFNLSDRYVAWNGKKVKFLTKDQLKNNKDYKAVKFKDYEKALKSIEADSATQLDNRLARLNVNFAEGKLQKLKEKIKKGFDKIRGKKTEEKIEKPIVRLVGKERIDETYRKASPEEKYNLMLKMINRLEDSGKIITEIHNIIETKFQGGRREKKEFFELKKKLGELESEAVNIKDTLGLTDRLLLESPKDVYTREFKKKLKKLDEDLAIHLQAMDTLGGIIQNQDYEKLPVEGKDRLEDQLTEANQQAIKIEQLILETKERFKELAKGDEAEA